MKTNYVKVGNLQVAENLYDFINNEALPGSGVEKDEFWLQFENLVYELTPINKNLLKRRDEIQQKSTNGTKTSQQIQL